jgi:hypothetical protein
LLEDTAPPATEEQIRAFEAEIGHTLILVTSESRKDVAGTWNVRDFERSASRTPVRFRLFRILPDRKPSACRKIGRCSALGPARASMRSRIVNVRREVG